MVSILIFTLMMLITFTKRSFMMRTIGADTVGLNALFADVIGLLNMADIGISGAIGAVLYKPISEKKFDIIKGIIGYYKKAYRIIGIIFVIVCGTGLLFINLLFKHPTFSDNQVRLYFFLIAVNIAITYFFTCKYILMTADQKLYIFNLVNTGLKLAAAVVEIILLMKTGSFVLYLVIELSTNIIAIVCLNQIISRAYKRMNTCEAVLEDSTKAAINKSIKGLVFHRIGFSAVFGTNYLYTTLFSNLVMTAIYSNYVLIINGMTGLTGTLFSAISSSIGNILVTENEDTIYENYKTMCLVNFWLTSIAAIAFYTASPAFITAWVGHKYIVSPITLIIFTATFFLTGIRPSSEQFKFAAGIFYEDRFVPIIEAIVNIIACLLLGYRFGMTGVVAGNLISTILIVTWQKPYMVYKYILKRKFFGYFKIVAPFLIATGLSLGVSKYIIGMIGSSKSYAGALEIGCISFIITNLVYITLFSRTNAYKPIKGYMKKFVSKKINLPGY